MYWVLLQYWIYATESATESNITQKVIKYVMLVIIIGTLSTLEKKRFTHWR